MFNSYYLRYGLALYLPDASEVADQNADFASIYKQSSRSAFWGNANALYALGVLNFIGADMPVNLEEAFRYFSKAMNKKHSTAAYNVYCCYLNGLGCKKDAANALAALLKAAELGSSSAYLTLGNSYYSGNATLNIKEDKSTALKYYKLGSEKYDNNCKDNYAFMLENGIGTEINIKEALVVYHNSPTAAAANKLGMWYYQGKNVEKDTNKAVRYFQKAVERGSADGMINLGYMYLWGVLPKDDDKTVSLWCDAVLNGSQTNISELIESDINGDNLKPDTLEKMVNVAKKYLKSGDKKLVDQAWHLLMFANTYDCVSAVNMLGVYYACGFNNGVKDYAQALQYYKEAAEAGCVDAYADLGDYYHFTPFDDKDEQKSIQWYMKAAENGNAYSMNKLGEKYLFGQYVAVDIHQALHWYQKAAEKGYVKSYYNLGKMYEKGDVLAKDTQKAIYWYGKGCEQNDASCAYSLGYIYYHGEGVKRDYSKALQYLQIAACNNYGPMANVGIALCYCHDKKLRNFAKALEYCDIALIQQKDFEPALKLRKSLTDKNNNLKPTADLKGTFSEAAGNVVGEFFGNVINSILTSGQDD